MADLNPRTTPSQRAVVAGDGQGAPSRDPTARATPTPSKPTPLPPNSQPTPLALVPLLGGANEEE